MEKKPNKVIDQTCLHTFTQHITVQYSEYSFVDIPVPYFVFSSILLNAASLTVSVFSALSLEYLQHWELTIQEMPVQILVSHFAKDT